MTEAAYRNHAHYLAEGWAREPKESFKALKAIVDRRAFARPPDVLDVGCATGELLGYLARVLPAGRLVGVDVSDDLLTEARRLLPRAHFAKASALALPGDFGGRFDLVCAMGCMSIFDETEIETFWRELVRVAAPGGRIVVFSPLNEHGVDMIVRHRKRHAGRAGDWERGWNIFSEETIRDVLAGLGHDVAFERFQVPIDLPRRDDPVRTWTMKTEHYDRQLTNGMKLLVDHYFMIVELR